MSNSNTSGKPLRSPHSDDAIDREIARRTRRSFLVGGVATAAAIAGWRWLTTAERIDALPAPVRNTLVLNETIARGAIDPSRLARTFEPGDVMPLRRNGDIGLKTPIDADTWRLRIEGTPDGRSLSLTMSQLASLPRVEMITELMCVEGWSRVVKWTGARFAELVDRYLFDGAGLDYRQMLERLPRYVAMATPDNAYFVSLDIESALHPQTLLCTSMNDAPLAIGHGAPLRLAMPLKYGYKNIKRIGTIRFSDERPEDYWGKRGYDWFAGL